MITTNDDFFKMRPEEQVEAVAWMTDVQTATLLVEMVVRYAAQRQEVSALRDMLYQSTDVICSSLCPSQWYGDVRPPHHELCQRITTALEGKQ